MGRPKTFSKPVTVQLSQLDLALLDYYADSLSLHRVDILRRMIRAFVVKDTTFDGVGFLKFVNKTVAPAEEDPEMREEVVLRAREFVSVALPDDDMNTSGIREYETGPDGTLRRKAKK